MMKPYKPTLYKKPGIYAIVHEPSGRVYVGSSVTIGVRLQHHKAKLRHNNHSNARMQNFFNKYGQSQFSFNVIEECPKELLIDREQYWIDFLNSADHNTGFNLRPTADAVSCSEETKEKLRRIKVGVKLGKMHSVEQRQKWSAIRGGVLNANAKKVVQLTREGVVVKVWDFIKQAADSLGIHRKNISSACAGRLKTAGNFRWEYFSSKAWLEV